MAQAEFNGADLGEADLDLGGDPACWMQRVCPECGRLAEVDPPTTCAACGTRFG